MTISNLEPGLMEMGATLPEITKTITAERIAQFEACSRAIVGGEALSNVHNDPLLSAKAGLRAPVASGMMTVAYLHESLRTAFGEAWSNRGQLEVSFRKPLLAGDSATIGGVVVDRIESGPTTRVWLRIWCRNSSGDDITEGTAEIEL
jgi:acyl dehydratase